MNEFAASLRWLVDKLDNRLQRGFSAAGVWSHLRDDMRRREGPVFLVVHDLTSDFWIARTGSPASMTGFELDWAPPHQLMAWPTMNVSAVAALNLFPGGSRGHSP